MEICRGLIVACLLADKGKKKIHRLHLDKAAYYKVDKVTVVHNVFHILCGFS